MGFTLFAGCTLVGFCVPFAVFMLLVAWRAQLLIVSITSSFFWLLSLVCASLVWFVIPVLNENNWLMVPFGVLCQEIARYCFFVCYAKAEGSFAVVGTNAISFPLTDLYSALAAGLGYGGLHTILIYGTIVFNSLGPGTFFADTCPDFSVFVLSAWLAFCFGILHMELMILAFDAYRRKSWPRIVFFIILHLATACMTIVNLDQSGCLIALPLIFGLVLVGAVMTIFVISRPNYRSKRQAP